MENPMPSVPRDLAVNLSDVAERLSRASSLPEFMDAIEGHRLVWEGISGSMSGLNSIVPVQLMEFCLDAVANAHRRLNDHQVETLIHIDRFVARSLSRVCPM